MTDVVTLQADPAAQAKLTRLLSRLQSELHQGAEEATRWTAYYVARSMGASMKVAPKERKFIPNDNSNHKYQKPYYTGYVWRWNKDGARRRVWISAGQDPAKFTTIKRRTLARSSWLWMIPDLGKSIGGALPRYSGVSTVTQTRGVNPSITLTNRLRYVLSAARTRGKQSIDSAFTRGATAGLRCLDNRTKKAMAQ
jgi:hypothetical protein